MDFDGEFEDEDEEIDDQQLREVDDEIRQFERGHGTDTRPGDVGQDAEESGSEPELFNGNIRPLEYYRKKNKNLDEKDYIRKDYAETTLTRVIYAGRQ